MAYRVIVPGLFLFLWILPASAQKVYLNPTVAKGDFIGNTFVFDLKEQLRKSATYTLVEPRLNA
jgi:hypothetical protein